MNIVARRAFVRTAQELSRTNQKDLDLVKAHLLNFEQVVQDITGQNIAVRFVMPGERVVAQEVSS